MPEIDLDDKQTDAFLASLNSAQTVALSIISEAVAVFAELDTFDAETDPKGFASFLTGNHRENLAKLENALATAQSTGALFGHAQAFIRQIRDAMHMYRNLCEDNRKGCEVHHKLVDEQQQLIKRMNAELLELGKDLEGTQIELSRELWGRGPRSDSVLTFLSDVVSKQLTIDQLLATAKELWESETRKNNAIKAGG